MAKLYNLAAMTVASTGSGAITLGSAATINGVLYLSFSAAGVSDGETLAYSINDVGASEAGTCVYTAAGTSIARTPITSTNSNAAISVTSAAVVRISPLKADIANLREQNVFTGAQNSFGGVPLSGTPLTVSANASAAASNQPAETPQLQIVGPNGSQAILNITAFGTGAVARFSNAGGTAASPTATQVGTILAFTAQGYSTSPSPTYSTGGGFVASSTEAWTNTANGCRLDFYAAPTGGTVAAGASLAAGFSVGSSTDPGAGAISATASIKSSGATQGIGYATGAGGTVTQITSRNTGVTLSKVSGDVVLLSGINAAVSAATANTVIVTNTTVAATDTIVMNQKSGTDKYLIFVTNVSAGAFSITFFTTGGTTNESPVFHFNVIKGVNS